MPYQTAQSPFPPVEITPRLVLQIAGMTGLAPTTVRARLRGRSRRGHATVVDAIQRAIAAIAKQAAKAGA